MLAEKFLLLLETLLSRVVDDKPPTVTSTPAAYPPNPSAAMQSRRPAATLQG
jgi:hypothetical protein